MKKISWKEGKRRLLKLADYLDTVKPKYFDFESWVGNAHKKVAASGLSCGTTACAVGHAANIPEFKRLGLKLNIELNSISLGIPLVTPTFGDKTNLNAAGAFFSITDGEAVELFQPQNIYAECLLYGGYKLPIFSEDSDTKPSEIAGKIRLFVAAKDIIGRDYRSYEDDI